MSNNQKFYYTRIVRKVINGVVKYKGQYKRVTFFSFLAPWKDMVMLSKTPEGNHYSIFSELLSKVDYHLKQKVLSMGVEMRIQQRWERKRPKQIILFLLMIVSLAACKRNPDFCKDGKCYYINNTCLDWKIEQTYGYTYGFNPITGKVEGYYGPTTERTCIQSKIDTILILK